MINGRIEKLRSLMSKNGIDSYIIVSSDYHSSEYVGDFFKAREFMSGFTGSAGTLLVTMEKALLWTDGRYFLQAEEQLKDTQIDLMKMREKNVPTIFEYLANNMESGAVIGFDGKTISNSFVSKIKEHFCDKKVSFKYDVDLVNEIWTNRPELSKRNAWELDVKYAGESRENKLKRLQQKLNGYADMLVVTALDEIAWLLNLRGNDVSCTPVFLAYLTIEKDRAILFAQGEIISDEIRQKLTLSNVEIMPYDAIYSYLSSLKNCVVATDFESANYSIINSFDDSVKIVDTISPTAIMKSVKNETEIANIRKAHIMDGVALCKFIYWLKNSNGVTELDAVEKLKELRSLNDTYVEESFDAIVAYGAHGAIVHYEPTKATSIEIEHKSLCLVDTGGHYLEGTTDVTRTIVMGELTQEERKAFTIVLKGNLELANARFDNDTYGSYLDDVARKPLREQGYDFNHGTGHGVGYLLSVHESPPTISLYNRFDLPFLSGMITSNEPGYYEANKFGIRHENLVLVRGEGANMYFETLTLAPFDLDAIDLEFFDDIDRSRLNSYHKKVFETISPYLSNEEKAWLKQATREI